MATLGTYTDGELVSLLADIREQCGESPTMQSASKRCLERLSKEFSDSLVLARVFATVPLGFLPEQERTFALSVAEERNVRGEVNDDTAILTLIASRGIHPDWNDPRKSKTRLAIPLVNASFVKTIPLLSRLLGESKSNLPWLAKQKTLITKQTVGNMAHLIYVEDASSTKTGDGYMVIPDQGFAKQNGVRTVAALGGNYLNKVFVGMILFTTEQVPLDQIGMLTPIVNTFKSATMKAVMSTKIF